MSEDTAREIVAQTPLLRRVDRVEFLDAGYSDDEKFVLWQDRRRAFLLRISPYQYQVRRQTDFAIMTTLFAAGVRCPRPFITGVSGDGTACFSLLSYLPGRDGEKVVPSLLTEQQSAIGMAAGRELRKLHHFKHPSQDASWPSRRREKYERDVRAASSMGLAFPHQPEVEAYVAGRLPSLGYSPVGLQHDDYHLANLVVGRAGFVGIIDFNRCDWGDPVEDLRKLPWFCTARSLPFSRGMIDGYLEEGPIEDFWPRYNLFVAMSFHSSLVWSERNHPTETASWARKIDEIVGTHDFGGDGPPLWYTQEVKLRDLNEV